MHTTIRPTRHRLVATACGVLLATVPATAGASPPTPTGPPAAATGTWHLEKAGSPVPAPRFVTVVGTLALDDYGGGEQTPAMFNLVDGQLYLTTRAGDGWEWTRIAAPTGVTITNRVGVLTRRDDVDAPARPWAFLTSADGHLRSVHWTGAEWAWQDHGPPPDSPVFAPVGVVGVQDAPNAPTRPYVFVLDELGNLQANWWTGVRWVWENHGPVPEMATPAGAIPVGVTNLRLTPDSPDLPHVFLLGGAHQVWSLSWDGSHWTWTDHGDPAHEQLRTGLGAVTARDSPDSTARPWVFVGGWDGVYVMSYWQGEWLWAVHGKPSPDYFLARPNGLVTVRDRTDAPERPYLFVCDWLRHAPVYTNWWGGTWQWTHQPDTSVNGELSRCGDAVTIQDSHSAPQRPYVFYWTSGTPNTLMVSWWG